MRICAQAHNTKLVGGITRINQIDKTILVGSRLSEREGELGIPSLERNFVDVVAKNVFVFDSTAVVERNTIEAPTKLRFISQVDVFDVEVDVDFLLEASDGGLPDESKPGRPVDARGSAGSGGAVGQLDSGSRVRHD